jgi:hypothetical protein
MISEVIQDKLFAESSAAALASRISAEGIRVYKCMHCGKLAVLWEKNDAPTFYEALKKPSAPGQHE